MFSMNWIFVIECVSNSSRKGLFKWIVVRVNNLIRFRVDSEGKDVCFCNRPESDQHRRERDSKDAKWDMQHNTYEEINPAHGKLPNGALVSRIDPFVFFMKHSGLVYSTGFGYTWSKSRENSNRCLENPSTAFDHVDYRWNEIFQINRSIGIEFYQWNY